MDDDDFPFYQFARLVHQAQIEGASLETLRLLVEAASARGAALALARCGLGDGAAGDDIGALRSLLDAWRDTKRTARETVVRWLTGTLLMAMVAGLAIKFKIFPGS